MRFVIIYKHNDKWWDNQPMHLNLNNKASKKAGFECRTFSDNFREFYYTSVTKDTHDLSVSHFFGCSLWPSSHTWHSHYVREDDVYRQRTRFVQWEIFALVSYRGITCKTEGLCNVFVYPIIGGMRRSEKWYFLLIPGRYGRITNYVCWNKPYMLNSLRGSSFLNFLFAYYQHSTCFYAAPFSSLIWTV
jgi:hypothetical protein